MWQFNLESTTGEARSWVNGQLLSSYTLRWPSKIEIAVRRVTAGVPVALGESATGELSLFDASTSALLAKALKFSRVIGEGDAAVYVFFLDLATDVIDPRFQADASLKKIAAVGEIRVHPGDGTDEIIVNDIPFEIRRSRMAGEQRIPLASSQTKQSGIIRVAEGSEAGSVVFSQQMVGAPVIDIQIFSPPGSPMLDVDPVGVITDEGFNFRISDVTPNGDYWIHWTAEILTDAENAIIPGTATRNVQVTDLAQGVDEVTITFDPALTGQPVLRGLSVITPDGLTPLRAYPGTLTAETLTLRLSDAPATGTYKLHSNVEVP